MIPYSMLSSKLRTFKVLSYERKHEHPMWIDQPFAIQFDTHNICNLNCYYCNPQGVFAKEKGYLEIDILCDVLKYFSDKNLFINYVRPYMNGDPLLETRLRFINKSIKKYLRARIDIYTNGIAYENRHLLLDRNLDQIRFTISAATIETYLKVHGKNKFNQALETLSWFKQRRRAHQTIFINFVQCRRNIHELEQWKKLFKNYQQNILMLHEGPSQDNSIVAKGDLTFDEMEKNVTEKPRKLKYHETPCCNWGSLFISYKGEIMQCCNLPYHFNYGHINDVDILEAWNKRNDLGFKHVACQKCNMKRPGWKTIFEKYY